MSDKKKQKNKPSVQRYLPIAEIRDDVLVTKEGKLVGVFLVSSINFALKSEEEQEAIIYSYVRFLNAIDFPLQVLIQSRQLDMDTYLAELDHRRREQTNELLKLQMGEYIQFVRELVDIGQIMTKYFYVVIPYDPTTGGKKAKTRVFAQLSKLFSPGTTIRMRDKTFQTHRAELEKRMGYVEGQMASMGLRGARLQTQSLIELMYRTYNPDIARREKLKNVDELRVVPEAEPAQP